MSADRITRELERLRDGGQQADLIRGTRDVVLYRDVPTAGGSHNLPTFTDAVVPIPAGYPAAGIDLAGLPLGSPLLALVRGGQNNQGNVLTADGRQWQLASYHPHNGGGGEPWDPSVHGFHTYFDHILSWLAVL
ncbi:MAG: hypothetical protein M3Z54_08330 [Gemmatimonadota bacterium]|nr:hypothetical protein [Gemmatimonadota bacterium]